MEDRIYLMDLFDIYGELLTQKQKEYFEEYYFNNLTLAEMAEIYDISRTAVHNMLKETEGKLNFYEEKLKLYNKRKQIINIIKDVEKDKKKKIEDILF